MKTINILLSDKEYTQLGIDKYELSFAEFVELINKKIVKKALKKSVELSKNYNLSQMTMEDISKEIKGTRNAKGHSRH